MTARYRRDGYILSPADHPPQTIKGGRIVIQAVEGRIDKMTFDGEFSDSRELLKNYGERIRRSTPGIWSATSS